MITSEYIVKKAERLITDFGMNPYSAYEFVYNQVAEELEYNDMVEAVKTNLQKHIQQSQKEKEANSIGVN